MTVKKWHVWVAIPAVFIVSALLAGSARLAVAKLSDRAPECSWWQIAKAPVEFVEEWIVTRWIHSRLAVVESSGGLIRVRAGDRSYWTGRDGRDMNGMQAVSYLTADHLLLSKHRWHVRPGDVVLDCGANIGVFADRALRMGASKVVAIEVNPKAAALLYRNFPKEISTGQVVVYPKGVWNEDALLPLVDDDHVGNDGEITNPSVSLTTIDKIVAELGLGRVDFIKLDIQGAELPALRGAHQTIARWKPRLMIDTPGESNTIQKFRNLLQPSGYEIECVYCIFMGKDVAPRTFFAAVRW